ncbi:MAG TPA: site-specific DNA-methyltransferase [Candidatus Wujingus californicus]|uniref:site-specific DNA-methyltransferase n=1 Tax=Candidatus Wujingus californicus TaxID=3367618 RepID=UPI0040254E7A|nr:site-specific DNA-methyltransferase [Planctomycetota bacterium]
MARRVTRKSKEISVESYSHKGKKRKNNPPVGLVSSATDALNGKTIYKHNPHIDPFLSWAGKVEGMSLEVQNVSLHIHERIDPQRIIKSFLREKPQAPKQISFFEQPENDLPLNKAIDFYRHEQDWTNRLIAGDSLLVMNSLLKKEGMAGKVQMIYIDPPYGIKYNSNFQPFVNKRDVKDGNDADIPAEPEMIQAFRDTWELGIHSYLTYLRERLLLAKELLHESGSCFVQISDENVHHVREIMDEVFVPQNFVTQISFRKKTMDFGAKYVEGMMDYLILYSKQKDKLKFRKLFVSQNIEGAPNWTFVELPDGSSRKMTDDEWHNHSLLSQGSQVFRNAALWPSGYASNMDFPVEFEGKVYNPVKGRCWSTTQEGIRRLIEQKRIIAAGDNLYYKLYFSDYPVMAINNLWSDTSGPKGIRYIVETSTTVVERCLLMTTDPGDLVLDPTCGSGTTAYVAEQWGRRWLTCDTSRVAITLAKQRLMTAKFDYYELAHPLEGIRSGFKYKTVPHITLGSIANNEPAKQETLYDQPFVEKGKVRVTGPFTVEAVPSLRVRPFDGKEPKLEITNEQLARTGETGRQAEWRDELKASGIRTIGGKLISFSRVEPMIATKFLHAEGEILEEDGTNKKAYISFGPDYGPLEQRQVELAINEARSLKSKPDFVIFAAFHFDPEAAKDIDQINWQGVKVLKAQMSVDLLTKDLRKKRSSNQSYWLIGQPDVEVNKTKDGKYKVKVNGFDYYDPVSGEIISKGTRHIAMWFLDTDYDERSLCPAQIFFPEGDSKRDWTRLAKALNGEVNEELIEHFRGVESLPFSMGEHKKIAVKIIDTRGIESFVIKGLK